ncbi:unnamed protein product [Blepharisma stoltei]|uniref:Photosystem I assembly protein Ycf4 n=1 Tax=Blepharisma stoltei TaxID=1481888 RepID=A0AAU9JDP4_9CILI|nr:unnamed protein product [Blepharisma stoltei]
MLIIRFTARGFAYKPTSRLVFKNSRMMLYSSTDDPKKNYLKLAGFGAFGAYLGRSLYLYHSSMGWIHLLFDWTGVFTCLYQVICRWMSNQFTIKEISLLDNGNQIEVSTIGNFYFKRQLIINIGDIINPELDPNYKEAMSYIRAWLLFTKQKDTFLLSPKGNIFNKEIFQKVIVGERIIIESSEDESKIIDI